MDYAGALSVSISLCFSLSPSTGLHDFSQRELPFTVVVVVMVIVPNRGSGGSDSGGTARSGSAGQVWAKNIS